MLSYLKSIVHSDKPFIILSDTEFIRFISQGKLRTIVNVGEGIDFQTLSVQGTHHLLSVHSIVILITPRKERKP